MTANTNAFTRFVARTSFIAALALTPVAFASMAHAECECSKDQEAATQMTQATPVADIVVDGLTISQPWSRATAKGARVAGGYLVLTNKSDKDDVLLSGSTDISEKFEVHEMAVTDGVMRMRKLADGLPIKAGETVELKPGSYHAMFIDMKRPLLEGDTFIVDMVFKNAGKVPVKFTVRGIGARDAGHAEKHTHKNDKAEKATHVN